MKGYTYRKDLSFPLNKVGNRDQLDHLFGHLIGSDDLVEMVIESVVIRARIFRFRVLFPDFYVEEWPISAVSLPSKIFLVRQWADSFFWEEYWEGDLFFSAHIQKVCEKYRVLEKNVCIDFYVDLSLLKCFDDRRVDLKSSWLNKVAHKFHFLIE